MAIRTYRGRRATPGPSPSLTQRLFCFPYAGAVAAVFQLWPDHLPPDLEVCIPCLPGRDARLDEPAASDMAPLVASLAQDVLPWLSVPYALFGHSMGAFIAFDLAHELSDLGSPPAHLFVSAQRGPSLPYAGVRFSHCRTRNSLRESSSAMKASPGRSSNKKISWLFFFEDCVVILSSSKITGTG